VIPEASQRVAKGWVFDGRPGELSLQTFADIDSLEPGGVACDVVMSTICGSDLHTINGRRREPTPLILGHEIVGRVTEHAGDVNDWHGQPLHRGDLVTWSIMVSCGKCFYCQNDLPQKCLRLHKYGHCSCDGDHPLSGGFAERIHLRPGTPIFKTPETLSPELVAPANCVLATACNAIETARVRAGESVLIQGAGLLGIYLVALCKDLGVENIIVLDINAGRLRFAERFGANATIDLSETTARDVNDLVHGFTNGRGVDAAFEVCGSDKAIEQGAQLLRMGGRYLIAGLVTAGARIDLPADLVTKRCLSLLGIHNYRPEHLAFGLAFLDRNIDMLPLHEIVGATYPLAELPRAIEDANTGQHLRIAVSDLPFNAKPV
jgi:alcohol dehydrogenase